MHNTITKLCLNTLSQCDGKIQQSVPCHIVITAAATAAAAAAAAITTIVIIL